MRERKPILPVKRIIRVIWGIPLLVLLISYTGALEASPGERVLYVGMLLGSGGLGDRSFNDSAYAGLQEAQRQFGIRFETINHTSDESNLDELRRLIRQGYDLIIGIGFENADYIETLSKDFPDRKFAVVDTMVKGDNVTSVVYLDHPAH